MESIRLQASRLIALRCLELINSRRFIGHGLDVFKRVDWELDGRKQLSSYGEMKSLKNEWQFFEIPQYIKILMQGTT